MQGWIFMRGIGQLLFGIALILLALVQSVLNLTDGLSGGYTILVIVLSLLGLGLCLIGFINTQRKQ
jgi:hypothetical protein